MLAAVDHGSTTYEARNGDGDSWKIGCSPNDLVGEDVTICHSYRCAEM